VGADYTWVEAHGCEPSLHLIVHDVAAHFAYLDMAAFPKRAQHRSVWIEAADVRLRFSADVFRDVSLGEQELNVSLFFAVNGTEEPGPSRDGADWAGARVSTERQELKNPRPVRVAFALRMRRRMPDGSPK